MVEQAKLSFLLCAFYPNSGRGTAGQEIRVRRSPAVLCRGGIAKCDKASLRGDSKIRSIGRLRRIRLELTRDEQANRLGVGITAR